MVEESLELILVADNNPDELERNAQVFREAGYVPEEGYDVKTFASAEELRDFYNADGHRARVKMVLTDNQMGAGLSGLDLARSLGSLVFVLSSTPHLNDRAKNDPTLGPGVASRIYKKQSPTSYQDIIESAIKLKALRRIHYTPYQIADACDNLKEGQQIEYKLKLKDGFKRNQELIQHLKSIYFGLSAKNQDYYLSCAGDSFNPRASKWTIGDKENIFYTIEHDEQSVKITKLEKPLPRELRTKSVGVYIDTSTQESKLLVGTEKRLQDNPGKLYGIFSSMFSARHFSRNSGFYTSNIN